MSRSPVRGFEIRRGDMKQTLRILISGLATVLLIPLGSAQAAVISGLYNTGVDDANAVLGDGMVDNH